MLVFRLVAPPPATGDNARDTTPLILFPTTYTNTQTLPHPGAPPTHPQHQHIPSTYPGVSPLLRLCDVVVGVLRQCVGDILRLYVYVCGLSLSLRV